MGSTLDNLPALRFPFKDPKFIFFTDFDGTITLQDSNDYMVSKHDGEAGTRLTENVDRSSGLWH